MTQTGQLPLYNARAHYRVFKTLFPLFIVPEGRPLFISIYIYIYIQVQTPSKTIVYRAGGRWLMFDPNRNCVQHKIAFQINGPSNSIKNGQRLSCTCFQSSITIVFPVILYHYLYRFSRSSGKYQNQNTVHNFIRNVNINRHRQADFRARHAGPSPNACINFGIP